MFAVTVCVVPAPPVPVTLVINACSWKPPAKHSTAGLTEDENAPLTTLTVKGVEAVFGGAAGVVVVHVPTGVHGGGAITDVTIPIAVDAATVADMDGNVINVGGLEKSELAVPVAVTELAVLPLTFA